MSYKLVVKQQAKQQIADGIEWYETQQKGLGLKFLNHIESYFKIILENPNIYEIKRKPFREAFVKKFPYLIIYTIQKDEIIISTVFNAYQDPEKKN